MKYFIACFLISLANWALASTLIVPDQYTTIQAGIDAASTGDTVLVQPGTYTESIDYNGKGITVSSLFFTTQDTSYIGNTIIDAQQQAFHVVEFTSNETSSSKLIGFTITGGLANGDETDDQRGGGIYAVMAYPHIAHCRISGNEAADCGGGASLMGSAFHDPVVVSCSFVNNTSNLYGGGLHLIGLHGEAGVQDCLFQNNHALHGGGMSVLGYGVEIHNSRFIDNTATCEAGGIRFTGDGVISRCAFFHNQSARGAAIVQTRNESPQFSDVAILNCTITGNTSTEAGGAMYGTGGSETVLVNTIAYGNEPQEIAFCDSLMENTITVAYSDIEGGQTAIIDNGNTEINWQTGNIDADPRFENPATGQLELTENSPCIDSGTAAFTYNGHTYLNMSSDEYTGSAPDMGAYESANEDIGEADAPQAQVSIVVYPNPFNPETTVSFSLPIGSQATVDIYDIRGQRVERICDRRFSAGEHSLVWNADRFGSGVYLVRMNADGHSVTKRVTLLK